MRISDWSSDVCSSDLTQQKAAAAYIAQLTRAHAFKMPIVTRLERGGFYPAEAYHQDFYRRNPTHPYIVHWDKPQVAAFRAAFPKLAPDRQRDVSGKTVSVRVDLGGRRNLQTQEPYARHRILVRSWIASVSVFFFQAEDGIRDAH